MKNTIMSFLPEFYITELDSSSEDYNGLTLETFITSKDEMIQSVKLSKSIKQMILTAKPFRACLAEAVQFHLSDSGGYKNSQEFYNYFKKEHPEVTFFFTIEEFVRFLTGLMQVEHLTVLMARNLFGLVIFINTGKITRPVLVGYDQHSKILSAKFFPRNQSFCNILISNPDLQK